MNSSDYYNYLLQRSNLSLIYKRYYLYPRLKRHLSGKVLDYGCGLGDFLACRPNTIGVDINPFVIRHCGKRGVEAYLIEKLPLQFENNSFQGILLDNVLEHLDKPESIILEIKRLLFISGTLIVGVPGVKGFKKDKDHKRYYNEENLIKFISSFGFQWLRTLHMPIHFPILEKKLSQYCIYGVFQLPGENS